jgi:hypothetical protein
MGSCDAASDRTRSHRREFARLAKPLRRLDSRAMLKSRLDAFDCFVFGLALRPESCQMLDSPATSLSDLPCRASAPWLPY